MKTIKNSIPFFQHQSPVALRPGVTYDFGVECAKFVKETQVLQIVFVICDKETSLAYYLLEDFVVGSDRYNSIVRRAYANESSYNCVIDVDPDDFERFSGECLLIEIDGRLHIDITSIEVSSTPCSSFWHNQAVRFDYFKDPSVEMYYPEETDSLATPQKSECFFVQPKVSRKLWLGEPYNFRILKFRQKSPNKLQFVVGLYDGTGAGHYILEEFDVDDERFETFVSQAYSVDIDFGNVVEFNPEELCDVFSGRCELEEHDGKLRINWTKIDLEEALLSSMFFEQEAALKGGDE